MNHRKGFNKLNRNASHRRALLRNMVTVLFRHERIETTKAKALEVRRLAEKMITRAKEDNVQNRRLIGERITDQEILNKLFTNIAPRMKERNGGYTRILKIGFRDGDAANMVVLELVDYKLEDDKKSAKKDNKAKKADAKKAETKKADKKDAKKESSKKEGSVRATKKASKAKEDKAPEASSDKPAAAE